MAAAGPESFSPLQFTWQAFLLTILNFLILVALLYKFLHKPLLNALKKRRERIEAAQSEAEEQARQAESARREYEARCANISQERDQLFADARAKTEKDREAILQKARGDAERQFASQKSAYERERREALTDMQEDIVGVALETAQTILKKLVDDEVRARLHAQLIEQLDALASKQDAKRELAGPGSSVHVVSAQPLSEEQRGALLERIEAIAGAAAEVEFDVDEGLIAGARVEFSARAIDATLSDIAESVRERLGQLAAEEQEPAEQPQADAPVEAKEEPSS